MHTNYKGSRKIKLHWKVVFFLFEILKINTLGTCQSGRVICVRWLRILHWA